jgi:hypothetical protein
MVTIDHIRQRGSASDLSKGGGLDRLIKDDDHNVFLQSLLVSYPSIFFLSLRVPQIVTMFLSLRF